MHEGNNMGIMTTLKKTYPRKGVLPPADRGCAIGKRLFGFPEVVDMPCRRVAQPGARPRLIKGGCIEECREFGSSGVGQGVGEAGQVVAFTAFPLHRHGGGQAQHVEEHLGQVVVDVLYLVRLQNAKIELCDAGGVAHRVGARRDE